MSSKKTKREKYEKNQKQSEKTETRGRNKKQVTEEEKKKILEEVEEEMKKYIKELELNEDDFIPYSKEKLSEPLNHYNYKISKMLRVYLNKINPDLKNKYSKGKNFLKKFQKIISMVNMNENEFSFFTILLDKIGYDCKNEFDIFEHLQYLCLLTMQYLDEKFSKNIDEKFNQWKNDFKINDDKMKEIDMKKLNERREKLTFNSGEIEKDEFLDYNQMVDDIIEITRSYIVKDNKNKAKKKEKKTN